jgi:hypothetical protein
MKMTKHRISGSELIIILMYRTKNAAEGDPIFKEIQKVQKDFFTHAEGEQNAETGRREPWGEVLISDDELQIISRRRAGVKQITKEPD